MSEHNPAVRYSTPQALAEDETLSVEERLRWLNEWEDDVRIRVVASEEGMSGPDIRVGLADILTAKKLLGIDAVSRDTAGKA
jgi:hypothetical protein